MLGSCTCERTSDIAADLRAGEALVCRLSLPQAKAEFASSRGGEAAAGRGEAALSFDEALECIVRCATAKFRPVAELDAAASLRGFVQVLTGKSTTEQVVGAATHIKAEQYEAEGGTVYSL